MKSKEEKQLDYGHGETQHVPEAVLPQTYLLFPDEAMYDNHEHSEFLTILSYGTDSPLQYLATEAELDEAEALTFKAEAVTVALPDVFVVDPPDDDPPDEPPEINLLPAQKAQIETSLTTSPDFGA